jgi:hypothetical protein
MFLYILFFSLSSAYVNIFDKCDDIELPLAESIEEGYTLTDLINFYSVCYFVSNKVV